MLKAIGNILGRSVGSRGREAAPPRFGPVRPARRAVAAKYDSALTNADNRRHWANADGLAPNTAVNPEVRRILRNPNVSRLVCGEPSNESARHSRRLA